MWGSLREDGEKGESPEESKVWRELTEGGVNGIITENDDERERAGDFKGVLLLEYLYNNTALHLEVCVTMFNSTADFFYPLRQSGSTYVFKGNSYWKFTHPGSAPEEGYPRLLAADWLDCPQPSSYSPGDISLISHYGQRELREQKGQRIIDQIRHKDKTRDKPHSWDCPCLNSAVTQTGPILLLPILFLITVIC